MCLSFVLHTFLKPQNDRSFIDLSIWRLSTWEKCVQGSWSVWGIVLISWFLSYVCGCVMVRKACSVPTNVIVWKVSTSVSLFIVLRKGTDWLRLGSNLLWPRVLTAQCQYDSYCPFLTVWYLLKLVYIFSSVVHFRPEGKLVESTKVGIIGI
jgi:hypothetical protein